jgi:PKD repeat protein
MKKKTFLLILLLASAILLPLLAIQAQGDVDAGPDQQVYTDQTTTFNGTTTEDLNGIIQVTWDFGDNTTLVKGTSPDLLNATHVYTATGVYNAPLTVKFDAELNQTETATATITVSENTPSRADTGPDR